MDAQIARPARLVLIGVAGITLIALAAALVTLQQSMDTPQAVISAQSVQQSAPESQAVQYETINGIVVPPEPDPTVNNATLAGVDVNNNGVRDDVERWIAGKAVDANQYLSILVMARSFETMLLAKPLTQELYDKLDRIVMCTDIQATDDLNATQLEPKIFNTRIRKEAYKLQIRDMAGKFYFPREECKNFDVSSVF